MTEESLELGREYPPENEELLIRQILEASKASMEHKPHPPTRRDQHPKSHGYVEGTFTVEDNLAPEFKIGVFAEPKTYPIWIRFSNADSNRGHLQPDTKGDIRGMAIKLMGVAGIMAMDDPNHPGEQDFMLINNPTFFIRDVQGYLDFFPVIGAIESGRITFNPDGSIKEIPDDLKPQFQASQDSLNRIKEIQAKSTSSPLESCYWSATPYRLGNGAMKFSVTPQAITDRVSRDSALNSDNYLREAMTKHLAGHDAYFDFKIQLQTDALKMPIEDPTALWDEQESPYVKIATIRIPQQNFNTEERKQMDEKQSFSPWHALVEHQPLGGVNRARKIYAELAKFRNQKNT